MQHRDKSTSAGFTLVEMLVIAPLVIVVVAVLISAMVLMTGGVLQSREESRLAYNVQATLTRIEADIHATVSFPATISPVKSPQGSGNDASVWSSNNTNGPLLLSVNGTTQSPLITNSNNSLVYLANQPNLCGTANAVYNTPYSLYIVYFLNNGTLWRRTILPDVSNAGIGLGQPSGSNVCQMPWQKNSCANGTSGGNCTTNDDLVMTNVQTMTITPIMNGGVQDGDTVSITAQNTIAAQNTTFTGSVYAISTNASPTF